jgi:hypothetical protein
MPKAQPHESRLEWCSRMAQEQLPSVNLRTELLYENTINTGAAISSFKAIDYKSKQKIAGQHYIEIL